MLNIEHLKFIRPSSFFYWEKCPLKSVFSKQFKNQQFFPKHPDTDLGILIHSFLENKKEWKINSIAKFEEKWEIEITKIDETYKNSQLQKIYFPIKWHAKYFAVKKHLLQLSLFKESKWDWKNNYKSLTEEWVDDGQDIGGNIDRMILNKKGEIIKIVDIKTGNIFEIVNKKKVIKMAYIQQLVLYAYIINKQQNFYPACFIEDIKGNTYEIEINDEIVYETYKAAIKLKHKINTSIDEGNVDSLANPMPDNCSFCGFRPVCKIYKTTLINNFDNKNVDVFGEVIDVRGNKSYELKIRIEEKVLTLKNISSDQTIKHGDSIYVYNLFCPDGNSQILFAMKNTLIKYE